MYQVARAFLLFGGEATHRFLYRGLRPLGECCEAIDELREILADELLAELLLELGLGVVERAAVEVADGVGDLGRQGDALLQEIHDVLEARWVPFELFLRRRARLDEHRGGEGGQFFRTPAPQVHGVYGPELLLVEDRRVAAHAVDAEALGKLFRGEDLLVRGVAGSEEREVVEERLGQVAPLCEVLDARRAVALAQFLLVRPEDLGDVGEGRKRVTEGLVDQDLARRVREVVVATDDVAYLHLGVVEGGGEIVGRGVRGLHQDEVLQVGVLEGDRATDHVLHHGLALARGLEADGVGLARPYPLSRLIRVHLAVLTAGIDRLPLLGPRAFPELGQFLRGGEVVVGSPRVDEFPRGLAVQVEALGLAVRGMRSAGLWTFVPVEADPTQRAFELLDRLLRGTLQVRVLYTQHVRATVLAGEEPVEERRAHAPDVQPPRRTRRVPDPDLCVVLHELNLTHGHQVSKITSEAERCKQPHARTIAMARYSRRNARSPEVSAMRTLPGPLDPVDARLTLWMARYGIATLRVALGVVFLWFGALKFFPGLSPAQSLAVETIGVLTRGLLPADAGLVLLATLECAIGIGLISGKFMRLTLLLLAFQMF